MAVTLPQATVRGRTFFRRRSVLLILATVLLAAAAPETDEQTDTGTPEMGEVLELEPAPVPVTQRDLLDEAVAMRRVGAFSDSAALLSQAAAMDGTVADQVAYQQGVLAEVSEDWASAIAAYERVVETWGGTPTAADARFRWAYCLEELGQHKAAIKAVAALQRDGVWSDADQRTMAMQRGITELRAGRSRVGIRRILEALEDGTNGRTWIEAKARLALVRALLDSAADVRLKGNKKAAKRLTKRSKLIGNAEKQAIVMFGLSEPEFALEGLLMLGDGYLKLYEDMVSYPPPRSVAADQREAYRAVVEEKAAILRTKAHARYDEGVRVAARTQWVGSVTERLTVKRDALQAQLAGGSSAEDAPAP
jgi:tetratricopeptide (TPR) repeat protein